MSRRDQVRPMLSPMELDALIRRHPGSASLMDAMAQERRRQRALRERAERQQRAERAMTAAARLIEASVLHHPKVPPTSTFSEPAETYHGALTSDQTERTA